MGRVCCYGMMGAEEGTHVERINPDLGSPAALDGPHLQAELLRRKKAAEKLPDQESPAPEPPAQPIPADESEQGQV